MRISAARYPWRYGPHAGYVVLEDPDGHLFCVVQVELSAEQRASRLTAGGAATHTNAPADICRRGVCFWREACLAGQ